MPSTAITLSAIDHTHSEMGLFCQAIHADLSVYNSCFLLSQIDTKNSLLYCTKSYVHCLPTYLLFSQLRCSFIENATVKKGFKSIWRKDLLQIVKKLVSGNHMMHIQKKNILNQLLTSPTIKTLLVL